MTQYATFYGEDIKRITQVEFTIYKNNDIREYSVVCEEPYGIDLAESYENYEPKKGGLVDLRLGSSDPFLPCLTCGDKYSECPGHFGHTVLAEPVFHYGFLTHLRNIMACICLKCSKLLIDNIDIYMKKLINKKPETRYKEIKSLTKNVTSCFYCGWIVNKIKKDEKDNGLKIIIERNINETLQENYVTYQKKIKNIFYAKECYAVLRNISDEDCFLLGFNYKIQRPEDMIIKYFPIPPVIIRPTSKVDFLSSATAEDGLTLKIADIINANKRVRQQKEKETLINETLLYNQDIYNLLQYHIVNFYDNDISNLPKTEFKTGGIAPQSISKRIQGKTGRVRCNLMGKRVDFSARTVITVDPYINIDEVGVPVKIAKELTIPEEVTYNNIKYLSKLVQNGRDIYPGANYVLKSYFKDDKKSIQKIDLKYRKKLTKINIGDIVERHIINGDYVLFNRQPTLHKQSMMGHKIQVINNTKLNSFRMNESIAKPYAADFDGDEMNIHLPQSIQTRNEIERIANVKYQIIIAKNSSPIIGCVQDTVSGAYMLSKGTTVLKGSELANILCNTTSKTKRQIIMNKNYTGHELFSYIIPENINIFKSNFEIINGKFIKGYLDNSTLTKSKNSLTYTIWDKYGPDKTKNFIDDTQKLILNYLLYEGQTLSFKDLYYDDILKQQIQQIISTELVKYKYNITQFENNMINLPIDLIETDLMNQLAPIQAQIGKIIIGYFDVNNFLYVSNISEAKGSLVNTAQMIGIVGQQLFEGARFKKKVEGRTMSYYHQNDDTPEARGFIVNSYLTGLTQNEVFYNASVGREGFIDTAIKTATTGYISRQIKKGVEDLIIRYDGSNRNDKGHIIQLVYGDNGIDQTKQYETKFEILEMNNQEIELDFKFTNEQIQILQDSNFEKIEEFNNFYIKKMKSYRDNLRIIIQNATLIFQYIEDKLMLPINIIRIIHDFQNNNKPTYDLSPLEIVTEIDKFLDNYDNRIIIGYKKNNKLIHNDNRQIKYLLEIALYSYLAPNKCIFKYNLTKKLFKNIMTNVNLSFIKALVEPGEVVGIISGNTLGEATTQMTMGTRHTAGTKSFQNMGVDRIQELLHYSKNIKSPIMQIYFEDLYDSNTNLMNKIVSNFKFLSLKELINTSEIYYDNKTNNNYDTQLKKDNVSNPFFINNQKIDLSLLPIVFRFKLNIEKMLIKEITLLDIKTKFITYWHSNYNSIKNLKKTEKDIITKINRCAILSNKIDEADQIIHIRFNISTFNYEILIEFLRMILEDIKLKGINDIKEVSVEKQVKMLSYDNDTGNIIKKDKYIVTTRGINMELLRTIKGIDMKKTRCNDIETIFKLYGIEAARQILLYELMTAYQVAGTTINHTHYSIIVDQMTYMGEIIAIDRHGLSKLDIDPLSRASFEKTISHFINASLFNEKDNMTSISSRIMMGTVIKGGTGMFDILLDTKKIENSEYIDEPIGRISFPPLKIEPLINNILNNNDIHINFFIPTNI